MNVMEEIRNNIEVVKRKFTFKIENIKKPIEIKEVNEGMARYRIMNIYHTWNMKLIDENHI